jgi:signal transduction histidine kinase
MIILGIILYCILVYRIYKIESKNAINALESASIKVGDSMSSLLNKIEYIMRYTISLINQDHQNLDYIANILNSFAINNRVSNNIFVNSAIRWLDSDFEEKVNSDYGVLRKPNKIEITEFMHKATLSSGIAQINPNIEFSTLHGEQIVSYAISLPGNHEGEHLGLLILDISLNQIIQNITNKIYNDGLDLSLLNGRYKPISEFNKKQETDIEEIIKKATHKISQDRPDPAYIQDGLTKFYYIHKIDKYPYNLLLYYDQNIIKKKILETLLLKAIEIFVIITFFGLLLVKVRIHIVRPMTKLAEIADKVSRGENNIQIPQVKISEVKVLANQLQAVIKYINEIKQIKTQLEKKSMEAESANKLKSEFIACISHELKTPLNIVVAFAEAIHNQIFGPINNSKYIEYSHDIYSSGKHLVSIINDIIDVARAESNMFNIHKSPTRIDELIKNVAEYFTPEITSKNIKISYTFPEKLPSLAMDQYIIKRALTHILSNAVKFTKTKGHIHISILKTKTERGKFLEINIKDTGCGMDKVEINAAFASFTQLDTGLDRKFEGIGLGLSLAKKFIEMQGGKININSILDKGTEVRISFRLIADEEILAL